MMRLAVLVFAIAIGRWKLVECGYGNCYNSCPDYYWRDYNGVIPADALEGGADRNGVSFYVGQAYFRRNELLPASIYNSAKGKVVIASAYNTLLKANDQIKILCSQDKCRFRWISTTSENLHLLANETLIVGGSEVGQTLYIGRVGQQGKEKLGKVFQHSQPNRGIWVPNPSQTENNYLSYEILTYYCQPRGKCEMG